MNSSGKPALRGVITKVTPYGNAFAIYPEDSVGGLR